MFLGTLLGPLAFPAGWCLSGEVLVPEGRGTDNGCLQQSSLLLLILQGCSDQRHQSPPQCSTSGTEAEGMTQGAETRENKKKLHRKLQWGGIRAWEAWLRPPGLYLNLGSELNWKHPDRKKKGFLSSLKTNLAESHLPNSPDNNSLLPQLMQQAVWGNSCGGVRGSRLTRSW